jgi:hypothetical protein
MQKNKGKYIVYINRPYTQIYHMFKSNLHDNPTHKLIICYYFFVNILTKLEKLKKAIIYYQCMLAFMTFKNKALNIKPKHFPTFK